MRMESSKTRINRPAMMPEDMICLAVDAALREGYLKNGLFRHCCECFTQA